MPTLEPQAAALEHALDRMKSVTQHLTGLAMQNKIDLFWADATWFLELLGLVTIGWQWLRQAIVAQRALDGDVSGDDAAFYRAKLHTFRYYFGYELPKCEALVVRLLDSDGLTLTPSEEMFA